MDFEGEIARKSGEPALLAVEAEKSLRAGEIGRSSGLFRVPRVLRFDEAAGILEFERERELITFNQFVESGSEACSELATRAGRAIARVHNELRLEPSMWKTLPEPWTGTGTGSGDESVALHGDFTAHNLCVDRATRELVIVDWSAAPFVGREATAGPRCFDLLCFIRHFIMSAKWQRTLSWPGTALGDRLTQGYVEEFGAPLSRETWERSHALMRPFAEETVVERIRTSPLHARVGKRILQKHLLAKWENYQPPSGVLR